MFRLFTSHESTFLGGTAEEHVALQWWGGGQLLPRWVYPLTFPAWEDIL